MTHPGTLRGIAIRSAKRAPMEELCDSEILEDAGVAGDFGRRPGRSQVTIVSAEKWAGACAELGVDIPWPARRANLCVAGVDLEPIPGRQLSVGAAVLEITGETDPCYRMDQARAGLQAALRPDARGGVRCRVVRGGRIKIGDAVTLLKDA